MNPKDDALIEVCNLITKRLANIRSRKDLLIAYNIECSQLDGYIDGLTYALDCTVSVLIRKELKDEN